MAGITVAAASTNGDRIVGTTHEEAAVVVAVVKTVFRIVVAVAGERWRSVIVSCIQDTCIGEGPGPAPLGCLCGT